MAVDKSNRCGTLAGVSGFMRQRAAWVFVAVLVWKALLLLFTAQPIPANDSFFYDGAVVNLLLHGRYCNPSLANALPISGHEVFSAYPPLYQVVLLGWMRLFGTSVLAAMWLHWVLFALYAALVLATLRALRAAAGAAHWAGLFLLGITFHDRPDSLAHVFGLAAVYSTTRAFGASAGAEQRLSARWLWASVAGVVLCLGTSLQIGGVYLLLVGLTLVLASRRLAGAPEPAPATADARAGNAAMPDAAPGCQPAPGAGVGAGLLCRLRNVWPAVAVMTLVPVALVLTVRFCWPQLWAGFVEHARQTPSLTSWRWPALAEALKIARTVPGVLVVFGAGLLLARPGLLRRRLKLSDAPDAPAGQYAEAAEENRLRGVFLLATGAAAGAVMLAALFFLTANLVLIAAYLQPLIVGLFLSAWRVRARPRAVTVLKAVLSLAVLLAATRAIGLTTVGVLCARDVNRAEALDAVARALAAAPTNAPVALSAAYLYDAWPQARRLTLRHADWLGPATKERPMPELDALRATRPAMLILTQFDYHRRQAPVLARLQAETPEVTVRIEDLARVRPPDASPRWQRVVQHVSWAPVIVTLEWARNPPGAASRGGNQGRRE